MTVRLSPPTGANGTSPVGSYDLHSKTACSGLTGPVRIPLNHTWRPKTLILGPRGVSGNRAVETTDGCFCETYMPGGGTHSTTLGASDVRSNTRSNLKCVSLNHCFISRFVSMVHLLSSVSIQTDQFLIIYVNIIKTSFELIFLQHHNVLHDICHKTHVFQIIITKSSKLTFLKENHQHQSFVT